MLILRTSVVLASVLAALTYGKSLEPMISSAQRPECPQCQPLPDGCMGNRCPFPLPTPLPTPPTPPA